LKRLKVTSLHFKPNTPLQNDYFAPKFEDAAMSHDEPQQEKVAFCVALNRLCVGKTISARTWRSQFLRTWMTPSSAAGAGCTPYFHFSHVTFFYAARALIFCHCSAVWLQTAGLRLFVLCFVCLASERAIQRLIRR
jgi:hypothetical protein